MRQANPSLVVPKWVLGVLVVQIAVPFVALTMTSPPTRFGFQMYSAVGSVKVSVVDASGRKLEVDPDLTAGLVRPELPWRSRLPEYLCSNVPRAASVTVEQGGRARTVSCGEAS